MARPHTTHGFRPSNATGASGGREADLDADELAALAERRPEALERFFDVYFQRVYGYVARLVRDEHAAEDLTQDVFLHVHRSLPSYDPSRPLRPWVFTIATNKVRDYWSSRAYQDRARGAEDGGEEDLERAVLEPPSEERGPREALAGRELAGRVAQAIERLPAPLRQTLCLRAYEGLSFEDIARMVERNEVAVRKRYSRALALLRAELGDGAGGLHAEGGIG